MTSSSWCTSWVFGATCFASFTCAMAMGWRPLATVSHPNKKNISFFTFSILQPGLLMRRKPMRFQCLSLQLLECQSPCVQCNKIGSCWGVVCSDDAYWCNGVGPEIACFVYGLKFLTPRVSLKDWPLFDLFDLGYVQSHAQNMLRPAGVTFNSQIKVSLQVDILAGSVRCGFGAYIENPCMITYDNQEDHFSFSSTVYCWDELHE